MRQAVFLPLVVPLVMLLPACATTAPASVAIAPGAPLIAARIVDVDPPNATSAFATATVQFTNVSDHSITVRGYVLEWDGGRERSDGEAVHVPPGSAVRRRLPTRAYDASALAHGRIIIDIASADRSAIVE